MIICLVNEVRGVSGMHFCDVARGRTGTLKGDSIRDGTVCLSVQGGEPRHRQETLVVSSFLLWLMSGRKQVSL